VTTRGGLYTHSGRRVGLFPAIVREPPDVRQLKRNQGPFEPARHRRADPHALPFISLSRHSPLFMR